MGLRADEEVRFARGRARKSPGCVVDHRRNDWASHSPHGESELSRLSSKRWLGRTEFLTATIASEPSIGKRKPSARAKWRSSPSAGSCVPITYLTEPTLLEMAMLHQQPQKPRTPEHPSTIDSGLCSRVYAD